MLADARAFLWRAQDTEELARLTAYLGELKKRHDDTFISGNKKELLLQQRVDSVKARRAARPPPPDSRSRSWSWTA